MIFLKAAALWRLRALHLFGGRDCEMTKFAPLLGLVLVLGLSSCGDDDGRIMLMDTGPGTDSGPGTDTGPGMDSGPGMDTGGGGGSCEDPLPALPGEALPRCAMATLSCIMACGADAMCQFQCTEDDTTPGIDAGGAIIDCAGCWNYQTLFCLDSQGCHDQLSAFFCCIEDNGCADPNNCPACNTQLAAVNSCTPTGDCNAALLACFP